MGAVDWADGTVMRSTAGAIVSVVVLWEVLPIVALHLPSPWGGWVAAVMLVPLLWMVIVSLETAPQAQRFPPLLVPHFASAASMRV